MTQKEEILIHQANEKVSVDRQKAEADPYRLKYHLMPPSGLLNDPNGLIHFKGIYHVFFQWNPFKTAHGAKFWGHYTSADMVYWQEEKIALAPSEWYEKNGCYSGSAIEHEGKMYIFYTGNVKDEQGNRSTYQCLAVSEDGITFEKKGPVVHLPEGYTAHFRDPKVWKHQEAWYMVLGAQTLAEKGEAVLLRSTDLLQWDFLGPIAGSGRNGLGDFGYMWECPDVISLNEKDILLVSPQGLEPEGHSYQNLYQSGYFTGKLDYENVNFEHGEFRELDRGFDFYAPQTFTAENGRVILYGWMGLTEENEPFHPTIENEWIHALTMPREIKLKDGRIYQSPVVEWEQRRADEVLVSDAIVSSSEVQFPEVDGEAIEVILEDITVEENFRITISRNMTIEYDSNKHELSLERRSFHQRYFEKRTCELKTLAKLHLFIDTSSVEVFANDGEETFTARFFPDIKDRYIAFSSEGTTKFQLRKWNLT